MAVHLVKKHMLHVECSLDADSISKREDRFAAKFDRGRRFKESVFPGLQLPDTLEQVVVHQFPNKGRRSMGGGRLVTVKELIHEIYDGLRGTSPSSGAVPSNFPLLRTLQLAAYAENYVLSEHRLIRKQEVASRGDLVRI